MSNLEIPTAEIFLPLLQKARYKGAFGGRGGAKSRFFSEYIIEKHLMQHGCRTVCTREIQKSIAHSSKQLLSDCIKKYDLELQGFTIMSDKILTPGDGFITFTGLSDRTADSIKSLEGFDTVWIEEAQTLSHRSLALLRPTMRKEGCELLFSWNPEFDTDAVEFLRRNPPENSCVVECGYDTNPWFPTVLEQERLDDKINNADNYDWIWDGGYRQVIEGAYYVEQISRARKDGRIGKVSRDDLMSLYAVFDIGSTGANADSTCIWICQYIGKELRVLDCYEAQGQPLSSHVAWLRKNGYDLAQVWLPHDGVKSDFVHDISFESALKQAGFNVSILPNQGKGAAMQRVEITRRVFPQIFINELATKDGIKSLSLYHSKKNKQTGADMGPHHGPESNYADAFGYMCTIYDNLTKPKLKKSRLARSVINRSGWMGG